MTRRDVRVFLQDVSVAAGAIQRFVHGRSLDDYLRDLMLRSAVERQFEIIGEALAQACALEPALADEIPEARAIIDFRNRIIHGYAAVDDEIVWGNMPRLGPLLKDVDGALRARG